jgi:N-acetylglucosaminyldiphosphoundecaprenol N-acetyl-beta-D-mannosaminyltransferase
MQILGIEIDNLEKREIFRKIGVFLDEPKFHQIATVNPEFVLESLRSSMFREIINNCDLKIADGIGIFFAALRRGKFLKHRLAGADLMLEILRLAEKRNLSIFLACRKDGLSSYEETCVAIKKICPRLKIEGDDVDCDSSESENPVLSLSESAHNYILFCNFGAPHQEVFINSVKSDRIRLAMGVGGSFDFLTGKVQRAPLIFQRAGLEWLWRIFQPQEWKFKKQRLRRIFRAVLVFPIRVILCKEK